MFGETPNIAARVQGAGDPGTVVGDHGRPAAGCGAVRRRGQRRPRAQGRGGADDAISHRPGERREAHRSAR